MAHKPLAARSEPLQPIELGSGDARINKRQGSRSFGEHFGNIAAEGGDMTTAAKHAKSAIHSITPHLVVSDAAEAIWFYKEAFGAVEIRRSMSVDEADPIYEHAVAAGCKVIMELADQFWGDRYAILEDPFGHRWSIGAPIRKN